MLVASFSDLVIQGREMELVAATYGRGIYMTSICPIQQASTDVVPKTNVLFALPDARLPWINDTHKDVRTSTVEKVPITFYLTEAAGVEIRLTEKNGKSIWTQPFQALRGFNQFRWDLIVAKTDSPQPYFFRYDVFAEPGDYLICIVGRNIGLQGKLSIVAREKPSSHF